MESDRELDDERTELREDEKKLQIALQEYDEDWDYASDDNEEEDERLLIDLEKEDSAAGQSQSARSGTSSVASTSQSHRKSVLVEDDRSHEAAEQQQLISRLSASAFDGGNLDSTCTGAADPEKTLALNRALQGILEGHIEAIQEALEQNKERQETLEDDVTLVGKQVKFRTGPFRSPYFRIGSEYPEPNEDVIAKRQFAQVRTYGILGNPKDLRHFQSRSKTMLRKCVLQDCLEQRIRPLMAKMEAEIERCDLAKSRIEEQESQLELERPKLEATSDPKARMDLKFLLAELEEGIREQKTKVKEHKKNVAKLEEEMNHMKNNTDEDELLNAVDSEKIDWMRISKMNYSGNKTWVDCQKAWDHYVNPKVTRGVWSLEEKERLKELVDNAGSRGGWEQVAKLLGTGRTPFQCMSFYQRNFNTEMKSRQWTAIEDRSLIEEANRVKDTVGFFNWRKVSAMMENRSPLECMARFGQIDPSQNHGKFTAEEDAKLLAGIEMFGPKWKVVARFIGTRNALQVRDRYMESLNPANNYLVFTYDEDVKLLKLHKELGPAWAQMCQYFQGRSAGRLGARYRQLQRWKKKKEWFDSQPAEVKRVLLGKSLPVSERQKFEARVHQYFVEQLGINLEDYKRQGRDLSSKVDPDLIPPRPPFVVRLSNVKSNMELSGAIRWANKISTHQSLREKLHKLIMEEAKRKKRMERKIPKVVEEENEEELMSEAVLATVEEQKQLRARRLKSKPAKLRKMERLLTTAFHGTSQVFVSKILETLREHKPSNFNRKQPAVDLALKKYFRQENRAKYRPGRVRKLFDNDLRSDEVAEQESAELKTLIPSLYLKSLGASILELYKSARKKHVKLQEKLLNFPKAEDDPDYLVQEARVDQQLEEIVLKEAEKAVELPAERNKCQRRKQKLLSLVQEKYFMEYKRLNTAMLDVQDEVTHFHRLLEKTGEITKLPSDSLAVWLLPENGMAQRVESCAHPSFIAVSQSFSTQGTSAKKRRVSDTVTTKPRRSKNSVKLGSQGDGLEGMAGEEDEGTGRNSSLRLLGQSELEEEQGSIDLLTSSLSNLPTGAAGSLSCLPPNVATLTLLKSLLLKRGELLRIASPLTEYAKQKQTSHGSIDIDLEMFEAPKESSVESVEDIILVDTHGQEIKKEDYAEFIQRETQDELNKQDANLSSSNICEGRPIELNTEENIKAMAMKKVCSLARPKDSGDRPVEPKIDGGLKAKAKEQVRCIARAKDLLSSNPQYNLANFSISEGSEEAKSTEKEKDKSSSVEPGKKDSVKDKEEQGKHGEGQSGYQVVVVPVTNRDPAVQPPPAVDTFLTPKPLRKTGRTYGRRSSSSTAHKSSSDGAGSSSNQFEFPELIHTGREVIEIVQDSSDSESNDYEENEYESADDTTSTSLSNKNYEVLVSSLQQQQRPNSEVVVVDVTDDGSRNSIVHFKQERGEEKSFKACESKPTYKAESRTTFSRTPADSLIRCKDTPAQSFGAAQCDLSAQSVPSSECKESADSVRKQLELEEKLQALCEVRQSQEYKALRARMRAMFLWPVLMSTVRQVSNPSLQASILAAEPPPNITAHGKRLGRPPKGVKSGRGRPSTKRLEQQKYKSSQDMQQKRQERMEARGATAETRLEDNADASDVRSVNSTGCATTGTRGSDLSEPVRQEDLTLAFPPPSGGGDQPKADQIKTTGNSLPASQEPARKKDPRGRKKGKKYDRIVYPPAIKRSKRMVQVKPVKPSENLTERPRKRRKDKDDSPPLKTRKSLRQDKNALPQWWKDAVLAGMMAKKTLMGEEGGKMDEVPIEEDEDFVEKGDYSDDEWVQDWKTKEVAEKTTL